MVEIEKQCIKINGTNPKPGRKVPPIKRKERSCESNENFNIGELAKKSQLKYSRIEMKTQNC